MIKKQTIQPASSRQAKAISRIALLRVQAEQEGDAHAQYLLGVSYANGDGVEQNYSKAVRWYRKAADRGSMSAERYFEKEEEAGIDLLKSHPKRKVLKWARLEAARGNAHLLYKLGVFFSRRSDSESKVLSSGLIQKASTLGYQDALDWYGGSGGSGEKESNEWLLDGLLEEQPQCEALIWKYKAELGDASARFHLLKIKAEEGDADSQYFLGLSYANGDGVAQSYFEAAKWYRKAAAQGHEQGKLADVAVSEKVKAEAGDVDAQYALGAAHANGDGVEQNHSEAEKWYQMAADQGHADAKKALLKLRAEKLGDAESQYLLAQAYTTGLDVKQDVAKAEEWFEKAAAQGHLLAKRALQKMKADRGDAHHQYLLAIGYANGKDGFEQNDFKAVEWYRKAAEQGHPAAQNNLGYHLDTGKGVSQNRHEAAKWFRFAAEKNDLTAQSNLGLSFRYGHGVEKNLNEALRWFEKAAAQGNETAKKQLAEVRAELTQKAKEKRKQLGICPGVFFEPGSRIADWLGTLDEIGPGLNWSHVATVGSGPLQLGMMDSILSDNDLNPCYNGDENASILIVGRNDWTEQNIEEQIEARAGKSLHIYSQEMAFLALLTGHDPFDLDDETLLEFGEGHPVLEFLMQPMFAWPSIRHRETIKIVVPQDEHWRDISPLTAKNYHVGKTSDLLPQERRNILRSVYCSRLDFSDEFPEYEVSEWGMPESRARLQKMVYHIHKHIGLRDTRPEFHVAVEEWREDLDWLKKEFYKSSYRFVWPR